MGKPHNYRFFVEEMAAWQSEWDTAHPVWYETLGDAMRAVVKGAKRDAYRVIDATVTPHSVVNVQWNKRRSKKTIERFTPE